MEADGEDPAAIAVLQFILQQHPSTRLFGCASTAENFAREPAEKAFGITTPPKVEVEWDYPPGPLARRERRGRAETAATAAEAAALGGRKVL